MLQQRDCARLITVKICEDVEAFHFGRILIVDKSVTINHYRWAREVMYVYCVQQIFLFYFDKVLRILIKFIINRKLFIRWMCLFSLKLGVHIYIVNSEAKEK